MLPERLPARIYHLPGKALDTITATIAAMSQGRISLLPCQSPTARKIKMAVKAKSMPHLAGSTGPDPMILPRTVDRDQARKRQNPDPARRAALVFPFFHWLRE